MTSDPDPKQKRYKAVNRATQISVVVNIILSIAKILAGILGHSAAMVADGIHSASDLVTDGVVLLSVRFARKQADEDHPYGHGKYETLATLFISLTLLVVAFGISIDAVGRLRSPDLTPPTAIALAAAILSLISKELLFQYSIRLGRRLDAKVLIANAWHQRSDAISSLAAMVGIGGAMMGWPILDPLAAMVVGFIIGKVGVELFWETLRELTDSTHAVDIKVRQQIARQVEALPEVLSAHCLTPRRLGPDIIVDVHVVVPTSLTVSEGHQVAEIVRRSLLQNVEAVTEAMVHIDTEEDHKIEMPLLPDREILETLVEHEIKDSWSIIGLSRIHPNYTPEGVQLDVVLEVNQESARAMIHGELGSLCDRLLTSGNQIVEVRTSLASVKKRLQN